MIAALIILASVIVTGSLLFLHHRYTSHNEEEGEKPVEDKSEDSVCCGMHIVCEKDSLLSSVSESIVYYDDEELDRFAGRDADDYTDNEVEQFRDVLLTLLPQDIAGWGRSIQLRGINLPSPVRDELIMIVAEARQTLSQKHSL